MQKPEEQYTESGVAATAAQPDGADLMHTLLSKSAASPAISPATAPDLSANTPIFGIVIGQVTALLADGSVTLAIPVLQQAATNARIACAPQGIVPGAEVAVMFAQGDRNQALVIGPMYHGNHAVADNVAQEKAEADIENTGPEAELDYRHIVIEAEEQLELRCGKAAVILMADGTILQRGTYIKSHASATQRILGGSVQIN